MTAKIDQRSDKVYHASVISLKLLLHPNIIQYCPLMYNIVQMAIIALTCQILMHQKAKLV